MNIQAHPDLSGFAPEHCRFYAFDAASFDHAEREEDARLPSNVGYGSTAVEAIIDLLEIMLDEGEITEDQKRALMAQHCSQ